MTAQQTMAFLDPFSDFVSTKPLHRKKNILFGGNSHTIFNTPSKYLETTRGYQIGDASTFIDWKAYARHEQLIVREVKENTRIRILIVIDQNGSMRWPTEDCKPGEIPPQKIEIALRLALHLACVFLKHQDKVSICFAKVLRSNGEISKSNVHSFRQVEELYLKLKENAFALSEDTFGEAGFIRDQHPDIAAYVSDAITLDSALLMPGKKRSMFFHVLSSLERDLKWVENASRYFPSSPGSKDYWGKQLRQSSDVQEELIAWQENLAKNLQKQGFFYFFLTEQTLLIDYFNFIDRVLAK